MKKVEFGDPITYDDDVYCLEATADEIRAMMDLPDLESYGDLIDVLDEAQGPVFSKEKSRTYVVIRIRS